LAGDGPQRVGDLDGAGERAARPGQPAADLGRRRAGRGPDADAQLRLGRVEPALADRDVLDAVVHSSGLSRGRRAAALPGERPASSGWWGAAVCATVIGGGAKRGPSAPRHSAKPAGFGGMAWRDIRSYGITACPGSLGAVAEWLGEIGKWLGN